MDDELFEEIYSRVKKAKYVDEIMKPLTMAKQSFNVEQVIIILQHLDGHFRDQLQVLQVLFKKLNKRKLECFEVCKILKTVHFYKDRLEVLEFLVKHVRDHGNSEELVNMFGFEDEKQKAKKIIEKAFRFRPPSYTSLYGSEAPPPLYDECADEQMLTDKPKNSTKQVPFDPEYFVEIKL